MLPASQMEKMKKSSLISSTSTMLQALVSTVDSRLSARGLTALRLNRGNVFLKKKFYFP
jgi:hypothetical protein